MMRRSYNKRHKNEGHAHAQTYFQIDWHERFASLSFFEPPNKKFPMVDSFQTRTWIQIRIQILGFGGSGSGFGLRFG